ncbi:MAG: transglutaminase domain-containing protein [Lentisphaerota bacterium]
MSVHDLNHPDFNPPDCPEWAKETLPDAIHPFRGRNGLPSPYYERTSALAINVRGVDRYHANQFVVYRPETAKYLYTDYTPLRVNYRKGLLPAYEELSAEVTAGCSTETEKAIALLLKGVARVKHPFMVPCGADVSSDRSCDDESLLKSGLGWCNEQARVFIRLCQVNNMPARLIHLFYSDKKTGHCISEFYADGRWCMADASWLCVFPGPDGRLLSAAQCHDGGEGQKYCGIAYYRRQQELLKLSDAELNLKSAECHVNWRQRIAAQTAEELASLLTFFAVINYPLPKTNVTTIKSSGARKC